jgi:tetratricopeptide (TPR) repeat protein
MERSTRQDPLRAETWVWLGNFQMAAGRRSEARASLTRSRELAPASPEPRFALALLEILEGRPEAALALVPSLNDDDALEVTALAEHDLGHVERARQALDRLIAGHAHKNAQGVAEVYAWWGDLGSAFQWLDRSIGQESSGFKWDPLLQKVRADPRYTALLRKVNLPVD